MKKCALKERNNMKSLLQILEESYRSDETKRKELKKEEGHATYYNVLNNKKQQVKQFDNKAQADAYCKACNKKEGNNFTVKPD